MMPTNGSLLTMTAPRLVQNPDALEKMVAHLSNQPAIALDTESNSLFRYYPKVCLIQISTYADTLNPDPNRVVDYLVDALRLTNLSALGRLLNNPTVEIIMHAAENDILILQRDFQFAFNRIFDTQLAARILGWQEVGLAAILQSQFGVTSDKRMQRTDWGKRPLTAEQTAYAQMDTHFLLALQARLRTELQSTDRWEEAQEAFVALQRVAYQEETVGAGRSFWDMKAARLVSPEAQATLAALWEWREQEAQRLDRPPFKVMNDQPLIDLATRRPTQISELHRIDGLSRQQVDHYGKTLLAVIHQARHQPAPQPPPPHVRPEQLLDRPATRRYDALRAWRTQTAQRRGVAPEIVFSNSTLLTIAQQSPRSEAELLEIAEIGPWKARTYGPAILETLKLIQP